MVSPQGASIGPPQSRMSRIWDHLRYGIPRRVEEFLEPETPAGLAGLLGASVMEPAGTAIDVADFAAGFRDRDLPRMGWAAGGAALPFVAGSTMRKVLGRGAEAADKYSPVIGGGKLKGARSPRPEEIADASAKGLQPYSVGLPASRADDGTIFTRHQPAEHGDLINAFDGYEIELPDGSFVEASFDGSGRGLNKDGWLVDDVFYSVDDVQRIVAPGETPGLLAKAADELPMDEASRTARREGWLADSTVKDRVYHGTTRDIKEFGGEYGNPENHYGAHHYFTDNADDASINYAGEGPDLTSRIELEGERMFGGGQGDEEILDYWRDRDIPNLDEIDDLTHGQQEEAMRQLVKEQLGIEHGGAVIPSRLRIRNPVVVGGDKETRWLFEQEFDEAGDFVGESGDAIELIDETRDALRDWDVYDSDTVMEEILGLLDDGEIAASDFDRVIRDSVEGLFDDVAGESASPGALIADIWKRMGYDAIDMDASVFSRRRGFGGVKLPGMAGTEGARHYVVFDPKNIRSDTAARFDPVQVESANLIAGGAGLLGAGLARRQRERE